MSIDWSKPLELMDGTPVIIDMVDGSGNHYLTHEDGTFPKTYLGGRMVLSPDGCHYFTAEREREPGPRVRNRATPETPTTQPEPPKTLRDEFAMAALMGLSGMCDNTGMASWLANDAAVRSYELADAMMAERKKGIEQ